MRARAALTVAVLLAGGLGHADTDVRRTGDRLDIHAAASPLTEVLDRLARQTGMKVIYDGPQPRQRVRVDLSSVTSVQAVFSILEGQGLNYAVRMDPTGTRIDTLLLVSSGGMAASAPAGAPPRPELPPRMFEREREQPEAPEPDEAPAEAQKGEENDTPKSPRDLMPQIPFPTGPAAPLTLPTPAPGGPGAPGTQFAPGAIPGLMVPGAPNPAPAPGFPPGVVPSPKTDTPQD